MYALLRALAGVALRWHYRDVRVVGAERIPRDGALLVAPNHPNALVDALLVGRVVPRRLLVTAKATLFANPLAARALSALGVLPLRRAADERTRRAAGGAPDPARNAETFRAVLDALARGEAVLMFPEGISWDEPRLAPLKTGAARLALEARDGGRAPDLRILPVGLVFERKEAPRSRVLVAIGEPIHVSSWRPPAPDANAAAALTEELAAHLEGLTLNYADLDTAVRERDLASLFAALAAGAPPVWHDRPLDADVAVARRIAAAREAMRREPLPPALAARIDALLARADRFRAALDAAGVAVEDVAISPRARPGLRFAMREGLVLALGGPVALWGRLHHLVPFRLARRVGQGGRSHADPAMRTIVAALVLTPLWYLLVWFLASALTGSALAASLWVLTLPFAEDVALRFEERLRRARRRARAWLRFRRDRELHERLCAELAALRGEAEGVESELTRGSGPSE